MNKILNQIKTNRYIHYFLIAIVSVVIGMRWLAPEKASIHEEDHLHEADNGVWSCSMHPQIKMDKPGKCPLCAMDLIPMRSHSSQGQLHPDAIQLSEEAIALANIQTSIVGYGGSSKKIRLYGKIEPSERGLQSQTAPVSGRIESLKVNVTGESIRKGEVLAMLYSPDLMNAQQELLVAKKLNQTTLLEATRQKLRHWKMTQAQIAALEQSGSVSPRIPLVSTVSGVVMSRKVQEGDYVNTGDVLYEIANLSTVWAVFEAYEHDLNDLTTGMAVAFSVQALPGKSFNGKIAFVDPVLDGNTRTARIRVEISNPNGELKPEMYASATIQASSSSDPTQLVVPESALLWTGKRSVVYVQEKQSDMPAFRLREITLGKKLQDAYVVVDGLQPGEVIVTQGAFTVDASAQLEGKRSMMNDASSASEKGKHGDKNRPLDHDAMLTQMKLRVSGSCGMCKERIESTALSVEGVEAAEWQAEAQELSFSIDMSKSSDDQVAKALAEVGHDAGKFQASADVYDKLPGCCHYR